MTRQPVYGTTIEATDFKGINGYESPKSGHPMLCPACGEWLKSSIEDAAQRKIVP